MYKILIATVVVATMACSAHAASAYDAAAETRSFKNDIKEDGSYSYQFDTSNGIATQEAGVGGYYATGSSQYYSPEGELIQLTYTADENGFQPQGAHLPTPPPIPVAILKALEYIRTHPNQEDNQGGAAQRQQQTHKLFIQDRQQFNKRKF